MLFMKNAFLDGYRLERAVDEWVKECGKRLQALRKSRHLTQEQLADLVGVRSTAISKIELGLMRPTDAVRVAIICALCVEMDEVWSPMSRSYVTNLARSAVAA